MLSAMNSRSGNRRSGFAGGNHLVNGTPVLGSTICCTGRQPRSRRSCSRCTPLIRVPISNGARHEFLAWFPAVAESQVRTVLEHEVNSLDAKVKIENLV